MIWDLGDDKCTHQLIPEDDVPISSVSIASDGSLLAAGNNKGDVYIWRMYQNQDSTTLQPCRVFNAHKTYLTRLLLSPDIKLLATCSADHTVRIWNIDMNEKSLETLPEQLTPKTNDGARLDSSASTTSSDVGGFDPPHNRSRSSSSLTSSSHMTSSSTASSTRLATSSAENTDSFRPLTHVIANRQPLPCETVLENHQRWVWDCAFSADSAYLVTVCSDHYARLWEVASATIIRQYNGHHRGAVCVALNDYSNPP